MKTYYKVLSKDNRGKLYSNFAAGEWSLRYKVGKWTKPKIGKLFVFDNLEVAQDYAGKYDPIYTCEVKNPDTPYQYKSLYQERWGNYWKHEGRNEEWGFMYDGTIFCDAVKLLEDTND